MIDAQHKERRPLRRALAVLAGASTGGEFVGAEDMFRPEIARPETVDTREQTRHLGTGNRGQFLGDRIAIGPQGLIERSSYVAPHWIIAGHRLISAFEDDDIL